MNGEKVIKDLEFCVNGHFKVELSLATKILALLKEQNELLRKLQKDKDKLCLDVSEWKHKYHDRALEEQKAVEPHYNPRTNWFECGNCHYSMTSGMHCRSELIPATKVRYCANCGFPINWEGR